MTFQFIIEYFDPKDENCFLNLRLKRVRTRTGKEAVKKFEKLFPNYEVINWRKFTFLTTSISFAHVAELLEMNPGKQMLT